DSAGKAALTGKAKPGDEMWSVPGGKPGAEVATFQGTKASIGIVESQVATQEHADTVAKAALTRRSLEFLTAEVEVQGNPEIKPGAMVNVKKVGVYSGHYVVTEANHFYDAAGYSCIFYVARDKWGDSSTDEEKTKPHGPYTVQITGDALALTSIDVVADDADAESGGTSGGAGAAEEKEAAAGGGGSHQEAAASGGGTSEEDEAKSAKDSGASGVGESHQGGGAAGGGTSAGDDAEGGEERRAGGGAAPRRAGGATGRGSRGGGGGAKG